MKEFMVLGTPYTLEIRSVAEDAMLRTCDGYCDKTSKLLVVTAPEAECELDDFSVYQRKVIRHEVIHAYLFESGLHENMSHAAAGHDEQMVDWFAAQYPKIAATYRELGVEA